MPFIEPEILGERPRELPLPDYDFRNVFEVCRRAGSNQEPEFEEAGRTRWTQGLEIVIWVKEKRKR